MRLILTLIISSFFYLVTVYTSHKENSMREVKIPEVYLNAQEDTTLLLTNGLMYYKGKLFSGYLENCYLGGDIKWIKSYYNGKLEGRFLCYYNTGQLASDRLFVNGEKAGKHVAWYPNRQKKFVYHFKNGLSVGNHKEWYPNGSLYRDFNYKDGKQLGNQKEWFLSGKLKANYVIRENGRKYGLTGVKRCNTINSETKTWTPTQKRN